jgi:hypothetical protein
VTNDIAAPHLRHYAIHQMQVRAADGARRHLDNGVAGMFNFWIRNSVAANVAFAMPA